VYLRERHRGHPCLVQLGTLTGVRVLRASELALDLWNVPVLRPFIASS
jgi:hypothetical protein